MTVLIVTNHYLDGNGGGVFASLAFINGFAEVADECVLLYPNNGKNIVVHNKKIKKIGISDNRTKVRKLLDIYLGKINRFSEVLFSTIDEHNPNLIVFDNSRASAGYVKILKKQGKKVITIHHNYEIEYYEGSKPPLISRYPLMHFIKKAEQEAVLYSDLNLTLTFQDLNLLQKNYDLDKQSHFCSVGIFEYKLHKSNVFSEIKLHSYLTFAITGNLSAKQTEISLLLFLKNDFPILLKQYPQTKLIIAGKNPSSKINEICNKNKNIELIANPENMSDVINRADVYICPISVGGGLKLRVMDGLKAGLPVLTHEVSARGYDIFKEKEFLFTYNNSESFEVSLCKLINDCQKRKFKKKEITTLYQKEFSFHEGVTRLEHILGTYDLN
jgi:hypothetical protein